MFITTGSLKTQGKHLGYVLLKSLEGTFNNLGQVSPFGILLCFIKSQEKQVWRDPYSGWTDMQKMLSMSRPHHHTEITVCTKDSL